jgi:uncharacterized protein
MQEAKKPSLAARLLKRYGLDALGAMALGLFSTLIVGTILTQIGKYLPMLLEQVGIPAPWLSGLQDFAKVASTKEVVGAAIGAAVAWGMKVKPLAIFTSAVTGAFGYLNGGLLTCYIAAVAGAEAGNFIGGKTRLDILLIPTVTILAGCIIAIFAGPVEKWMMAGLQSFINIATLMQPIPMGIIVSVVVGLVLTAPISSAALCAIIFTMPKDAAGALTAMPLGLQLAAGAATAGCCAQMVGFAVSSYRENGVGGLVAQGLGTSMLQVPNILLHPLILIPATLASAITGPLATTVFRMGNYGVFAGMGTSGLVGQIGTLTMMTQPEGAGAILKEAGSIAEGAGSVLIKILLLHILLPAALSLLFSELMRKMNWIKSGDMKLKL